MYNGQVAHVVLGSNQQTNKPSKMVACASTVRGLREAMWCVGVLYLARWRLALHTLRLAS
jgi:hypothetical protein